MKKFFCLFFAAVLLLSCAPTSKEDYISDYKEFINKVSDEYKTYNDNDWNRAERKLDKFSGEWYDKFSKELSAKEKIVVAGYKAKFKYLYALGKSGDTLNDIVDSFDGDDTSEFEKYIENDLKDDVNNVVKEAEKAGEDLVDYIEDLIDDLER